MSSGISVCGRTRARSRRTARLLSAGPGTPRFPDVSVTPCPMLHSCFCASGACCCSPGLVLRSGTARTAGRGLGVGAGSPRSFLLSSALGRLWHRSYRYSWSHAFRHDQARFRIERVGVVAQTRQRSKTLWKGTSHGRIAGTTPVVSAKCYLALDAASEKRVALLDQSPHVSNENKSLRYSAEEPQRGRERNSVHH